MTTPRILRSPEAHRDLLDIWAYITDKSSPSIADGFLARLSGAMEVIAYAPHIGRERSEFRGRPRSVVVNPYVIFYEPLPEGDGILVWRVIHGRRELSRLVRRPRR